MQVCWEMLSALLLLQHLKSLCEAVLKTIVLGKTVCDASVLHTRAVT